MFVATHMIEHITAAQLELLIASIQAPYVYLEAPLPDHDGEQWHDYPGTHILEIGWPSVDALLRKYEFEVLEGQGDCRLYQKKDPAEAGS